jgi:hypothetical protein
MELGSQSLVSPYAPRRDPNRNLRNNRKSELPFDDLGNAATRGGGPTRESNHLHGPPVIVHLGCRCAALACQWFVFRFWTGDHVALRCRTTPLETS